MTSTWPKILSSSAAFALALGWYGRDASAAPLKVACIGEHTTHSHHFPPLNRDTQPPATQEYPAMLQTLLGAGYQVRNFGDCCGSVLQGYTPQETHPYVLGSLSAAEGPGYVESIAFMPDIVVIGSWGRHDWGKAKATTATWNAAKFETDYDDLVQRYQRLPTHPIIFVSLPIPIPNGEATPATGVATSSVLPAVRNVAAKYNLPIIDLYTPFLGHRELFKQPPDAEGEGEHVTDGPGLHAIADAVYAAIVAYPIDGGSGADAGAARDASVDASASSDASPDRSQSVTDATTGEVGPASPDGSTAGGGGAGAGSGGSGGASSTMVTGGPATGGATAGAANTGGADMGGSSGGASPTGGSSSPKADGAGCACASAKGAAPGGRWLALSVASTLLLAMKRRSRNRPRRA